jgi:KipI family sensor histidine kinase inhibitor
VELDDAEAVIRLHRSIRADPPTGLVESVPAALTVLLVFDPAATDAALLAEAVTGRSVHGPATPARTGTLVEIPVAYDGLDLAEVAERTGLSQTEVVARHRAPSYTVAFFGYAPGFGYLTGLDPSLRLPRRANPRTRVPAGAVAIADEFTGVYPRAAPGGWHILGHTDTPMWMLDRDPPALLRPGDRVRFVEVRPDQQPPTDPAPRP